MPTYKVSFDLSGCISHIGSDIAGIGVENVSEWAHSDTLFSSLMHAYAKKHGFDKSSHLIRVFTDADKNQKEPPFRCSSLFLGKDEKMFFPKPKKPLPDTFDWTQIYKIKFISMQNLLNWLELKTADWTTPEKRQEFIDQLVKDQKEYNQLFLNRIRAVNARDRIRNQTSVFHRGETLYSEGTKGSFFIDIESDWVDEIQETIHYLAEFGGIGGELSIGFSQMKFEGINAFAFPQPVIRKNAYLISLYPIQDTINWENAYYDIINRKSWLRSPFIGTQLKKKAVKMLTEGSCLPTNLITGKLIDVSPDEWKKLKNNDPSNWHPIYRNGIGYAIFY